MIELLQNFANVTESHTGFVSFSMPHKNLPNWSVKLPRSLTLKDGTTLVTLADARREVLIRYFETAIASAAAARAVEWLLTAAESGSITDWEVATDQVEIVLRSAQPVEPFGGLAFLALGAPPVITPRALAPPTGG